MVGKRRPRCTSLEELGADAETSQKCQVIKREINNDFFLTIGEQPSSRALEHDDLVLPISYSTWAAVRAAVRQPSFIMEPSLHSYSTSCTVVVRNFFSTKDNAKCRHRNAHTPSRAPCTAQLSTYPYTKKAREARQPCGCSSAFIRAVQTALRFVLDYIGCAEEIPSPSLLLLHIVPQTASALRQKLRRLSIGALCIAEERFSTNRVLPIAPSPYSTFVHDQAHYMSDTQCTGTTFCGIRLIWVATGQQRQGVATSLTETARQHLTYGYVIPRRHVAFHEPTAAGTAFARHYTDRCDFLIY